MDVTKLEQFISVTGASREVARVLLEACGGNLDLAINMHLEGGGDAASGEPQAGPSSLGSAALAGSEAKSYEEIHGVRAPIPQTRGVLIEEELPPPRQVLRSRRLPQTVFDPFQDYSSSHRYTGPGDENKKKSLAELFKPPVDILFMGTFQEARFAGQVKQKWLLVNVQDSSEFASQVLNRDVWSNHNVKETIRQYFIFWQIQRITDDGVRFKQLYHVTSFPYIAIIDPRTGEKIVDWNALTVQEFLSGVHEFLANNSFGEDVDGSDTVKQSDSIVDQSEESQIEAAIRASLQEAEERDRRGKQQQTTIDLTDDSDECVSISSEDSNTEVDFSHGRNTGDIDNSAAKSLQDLSNVNNLTAAMKLSAKSELHSDGVWRLTRQQMKKRTEGIPQGKSEVGDISSLEPCIQNDSLTQNSGVKLKSPFSMDVNDSDSGISRKRKYAEEVVDEEEGAQLRKCARGGDHREAQTDKVVADDSKRLKTEQNRKSEQSQKTERTRRGKGRVGAAVKQKGMSTVQVSDGTGNCLSVEEQVASGSISKDEVSQIVVRMPNGSRVQKSFICHHPIEELFHFLRLQDIDLDDNEILTQFPRRSLSTLQQTTSFKEAGLYPREMVFVHPCD